MTAMSSSKQQEATANDAWKPADELLLCDRMEVGENPDALRPLLTKESFQ